MIRRMKAPSLAQVPSHAHRSPIGLTFIRSISVVPHVKHKRVIALFRNRRFRSVCSCFFGNGPGFTLVTTLHKVREWIPPLISPLTGNNQYSRRGGDTVSRCWSKKKPLRLFHPPGPIFRFAPSFSIILGTNHHKLRGFFQRIPGITSDSTPLMSSGATVRPQGRHENFTSLRIHEDIWV